MPEGKKLTDYTIVTELKDATASGAQGKQQGTAFTGKQFEQEFIIEHPSLWTPDTPALYTAEIQNLRRRNTERYLYNPFSVSVPWKSLPEKASS